MFRAPAIGGQPCPATAQGVPQSRPATSPAYRRSAKVSAVASPPRRHRSPDRPILEAEKLPAKFTADLPESAAPHHAPGHSAPRSGVIAQAGSQAPTLNVTSLWAKYTRSVETNPVQTKALTSLFGFMLGDILAQRMEGVSLNPARTMRLGVYGVTLDGPLGHFWYKLLDKYVYPNDHKCTAAVLIKTAADQLVWAPVMTCVFFAVLKSLEGHPELVMSTIQDKLLKTLVANYVLWPLAHFINFKFVPSEHRILYNNSVAVLWNAYLSTLSHQPTIDIEQLLGVIGDAQDVLADWVPDVPESLAQQLGIPTQQIFDQILPGAELPSIPPIPVPPLNIPKQFTLGPSPKNIFGWLSVFK